MGSKKTSGLPYFAMTCRGKPIGVRSVMIMKRIHAAPTERDAFFHFDLDGTLLSTGSAIISAYREAVASFGGKWTEEASKCVLKGMKADEFLKVCLNVDPKDIIQIQQKKIELYPSKFEEIELITPVINLLYDVSPKAAVVTSASRDSTVLLLRYFGLNSYFSHLVTSSDVVLNKPSPECYIKSKILAERSYGLNISHVAIEDSAIGIEAAHAAGLRVLDVNLLL